MDRRKPNNAAFKVTADGTLAKGIALIELL